MIRRSSMLIWFYCGTFEEIEYHVLPDIHRDRGLFVLLTVFLQLRQVFKQTKFHFIAFLYMTILISGLTINPLFLNFDNVYFLHTNVNII